MARSRRSESIARRHLPWKRSLYARALLFTLIGSGSLLGAIIVQSTVLVRSSVDRLLEERVKMAQNAAGFVEYIIRDDLGHLAEASRAVLESEPRPADLPAALRERLGTVYPTTIFREGGFVLDLAGKLVASAPETPRRLERMVNLPALARKSKSSSAPVISPLVPLPTGDRQVLLALMPVAGSDGGMLGFAGGLLHPVSANLFGALNAAGRDTSSTLQLVDTSGIVIASTNPFDLFTPTDHGSILTGAIRDRRAVSGRCHACHVGNQQQASEPVTKQNEVLAFAPLPRLSLGIAVRQSEREAFAPAFVLQRKLVFLGSSFVLLFLLFTGLAVHSVVRPVTRLTQAVREVEHASLLRSLPLFGRDEVGELARALDRWRARLLGTLQGLKAQEAALQSEVERTRRHLAALQNIAEFSSKGLDFEGIANHGLERLLGFLGLPLGVLCLIHDDKRYIAVQGLGAEQAECLLEGSEARLFGDERVNLAGLFRIQTIDPQAYRNKEYCQNLKTLVMAGLKVPEHLKAICIVGDVERRQLVVEDRHIQSFLHHIMMSAANRLLHEQEALRTQQSRDFLQRLMTAQEDERRRIARELHDTIAQDLAAHRLQIERLGHVAGDGEVGEKLKALETQAQTMLGTLRQLLVDLRPSVLDTMGFLPAIQWYLERVEREKQIRGTLSIEGDEKPLPHDVNVMLFRIFQESLQNIVVHAKAEHVFVTVDYDENGVFKMTIEDDGVGFERKEIGAVKPDGHGLGLLGMIERANIFGGQIEIDSKIGEGTTIAVSVPWSKYASATSVS